MNVLSLRGGVDSALKNASMFIWIQIKWDMCRSCLNMKSYFFMCFCSGASSVQGTIGVTHPPPLSTPESYTECFEPEGEGHTKQNLSKFRWLSQTFKHFFEKHGILKKIVWETQKLHWNFSTPHSSWVMGQNVQNIVLISNSRTPWPTKILKRFLSFSDNLLHEANMIFSKKVSVILG